MNFSKNITLYRLLRVFGANGLMTPVIYFFFTVTKGLTPAQALLLVGLGGLASAIFEVPTGVVADKFSRKYSILIGYTIALVGWVGMLGFSNFWILFILTFIKGIGGSFISGADDALLYDSLKELKQSDKFKSIYSLSQSIDYVAFAITVFIGGILGGVNLLWPVYLHILFIVTSVVLSYMLVEPKMTEEGEKLEQVGYLDHTWKSIKTIFSKKGLANGLMGSFVSLALILAVFKSTKNILSPVLDQYGLSVSIIGSIISAIILIKSLGAFIASKFIKHGNEIKEISISLFVCISGLFAITVIQIPLIQLLIFILIIGLDNVVLTNLKTIVNEKIDSSNRSTVLSLLSLFARSTEILFLTSFGWFIDLYPFRYALWFTAIWLIAATSVFMFMRSVDNVVLSKSESSRF